MANGDSTPSIIASPATLTTASNRFAHSAFQRQLIYERETTVSEAMEDLAQLAAFDRAMEREEATWKSRAGYCTIAVITSVVATIASFAGGIVLLGVAVGMFGIGALIAVTVCGIKWARFSRVNLDNRRVAFPRQVLNYLAHDMSPDALVRLKLDFRAYRDNAFLKGQQSGGMFSGVRQYQYAVPWFTIAGQFLDGHRFELEVTTTAKRKEKSKRKYTKVNETFRERLRLFLRVKSSKYPKLSALPRLVQEKRFATPFAPTDLAVRGDTVILGGVSAPVARRFGRGQAHIHSIPENGLCTADQALQSFLALYAGLEMCR
jgi:hypothetical protein